MYNNYQYNYRYDNNCCCLCGFIRCICNKIRYCLCPRRYYPYYHDGYGHGKDCGKQHYCGGNIGQSHAGSDCYDKKGYDNYIDPDSYYDAIRKGRYCARTKKF